MIAASSVLTGFADAGAWVRSSDGTIVGRARNGSWAERVRAGVPIDAMMDSTGPELESCIIQPVQAAESFSGPYWRGAGGYYERYMDESGEDTYIYGEYDAVFPKETDAAPLRAKRTSHKLAAKPSAGAKPSKYGPKQTKLRTAAAKDTAAFAEPILHPSTVPAATEAEAKPAVPATDDRANLLRNFLAMSVIAREWLADLADFAEEADLDLELTEEEIEAELLMQRIRDARYERH